MHTLTCLTVFHRVHNRNDYTFVIKFGYQEIPRKEGICEEMWKCESYEMLTTYHNVSFRLNLSRFVLDYRRPYMSNYTNTMRNCNSQFKFYPILIPFSKLIKYRNSWKSCITNCDLIPLKRYISYTDILKIKSDYIYVLHYLYYFIRFSLDISWSWKDG